MKTVADTSNVVPLDLGRFTERDAAKVFAIRDKLRLMHRWYRCERTLRDGLDTFLLYSGDRGPARYSAYRIVRRSNGAYELASDRTGQSIATARTIDFALDALPDDFYYAR